MKTFNKNWAQMSRNNPAGIVYALILSLFYGVIAAGQILGFCKLYKPLLIIPASLVLSGLIFYFYLKNSHQFIDSASPSPTVKKNPYLTTTFVLGGLILFLVLVFYPLLHWPFSPIITNLTWDAGLYHFPKAAEMISTSSAWDLSISYGEYPFGYESMIAFSLMLNRSGLLIGSVHAFISLFLFLSIGVLITRRTKLPQAPVFFVTAVLFLGARLAPHFDSNIWMIYWSEITQIGKNDALLAAALLAVLLHTPSSRSGPFFPLGLAAASMIALSIKPNALPIVVFAWLVMLYFLSKAGRFSEFSRQILASAVLMLPGVLWMLRNLLAQGTLISPEAMQLSSGSIAQNLNNPYFYHYIPQHLYLIFAIILITGIVSIFKPCMRFDVLTTGVLLASFIITPASAFLNNTQVPAQIAWRFAVALLAYIFLLLLSSFEKIILAVYNWIAARNAASILLGVFLLFFTAFGIWSERDLLTSHPEMEFLLHDQYQQSVGVDGYHSAYDYVQKNINHSVVNIENGLPYYLYDPLISNSVTRSNSADYVVYLQTPWINEGGYPEYLDQPDWQNGWLLVYEDGEGRVYKRK